jgi:hypothetical protein
LLFKQLSWCHLFEAAALRLLKQAGTLPRMIVFVFLATRDVLMVVILSASKYNIVSTFDNRRLKTSIWKSS